MAEPAAPKKAAEGGIVVPLLIVLVLGAGAGFGYGTTVGAPLLAGPAQGSGSAEATDGRKRAGSNAESGTPGKPDADRMKDQIVPLDPVIVNIGGGTGRWLRMEGAVAFAQPLKEGREALVAQLNEDLMSYLRSTSLAQVESASGLEFLRDDLSEIVQLRTKGRARMFVLRSLVVE